MGSFIEAGGNIIEGESAWKAAQYNANIQRRNAVLTRQQAAEEARLTNVQGRKALGEMKASYGASGVAFEGSAYDVMRESAKAIKYDELAIKYQGKLQAQSMEQNAKLIEYEGKVAKQLGYVKAAANVANGITRIAFKDFTMGEM